MKESKFLVPLYLSEHQRDGLNAMATKSGKSRAEIMREIVDMAIAREECPPDPQPLKRARTWP